MFASRDGTVSRWTLGTGELGWFFRKYWNHACYHCLCWKKSLFFAEKQFQMQLPFPTFIVFKVFGGTTEIFPMRHEEWTCLSTQTIDPGRRRAVVCFPRYTGEYLLPVEAARYGYFQKNRSGSSQIINFNRSFHYFHHPFSVTPFQKYGCFPPKSSILIGFSTINPPSIFQVPNPLFLVQHP